MDTFVSALHRCRHCISPHVAYLIFVFFIGFLCCPACCDGDSVKRLRLTAAAQVPSAASPRGSASRQHAADRARYRLVSPAPYSSGSSRPPCAMKISRRSRTVFIPYRRLLAPVFVNGYFCILPFCDVYSPSSSIHWPARLIPLSVTCADLARSAWRMSTRLLLLKALPDGSGNGAGNCRRHCRRDGGATWASVIFWSSPMAI